MSRRRKRPNNNTTGRSQHPQTTRRLTSLPPGTSTTSLSDANAMYGMLRPSLAKQQVGSKGGQYPGANPAGINAIPASAYSDEAENKNAITAFPPGDPIRPVPGLSDGSGGPRQFAYPASYNIATQPRQTELTTFQTLRNLSVLYSGVGLCERAIFRILERLDLQIVPRAHVLKDGEDPSDSKWTEPGRRMADWFQEGPDKRGNNLKAWMTAAMRDILELDACVVFHHPTRDGSLACLEPVDGATIVCLVDESGRTPLPPSPAYRQVLYGAPGVLLTQQQVDYLRTVTRTDSPYGISPVEQIMVIVNTALRKQNYDLTRYTDGSTPEGILQTSQPELFKMTVDEVMQWEQMWNGVLAGNDRLRVRTKAVPPGWTFTSTEQPAIATELDEYLLNVTVSAFGLTKDELGFTDTSNRSTGQTQESVTYRNAVRPRTDFFADYFTRVIARYDGQPLYPGNPSVSVRAAATKSRGTWDARFRASWTGIEEPENFNAKSAAYSTLVKAGIVGPTQAKRELGIPLEPGEEPVPAYVTIPTGPQGVVFIQDLLKQREQMADTHGATLEAQEASAKQTKAAMEAGVNGAGAVGNMAQVAQQQAAHNASVAGQGASAIAPGGANIGAQAAQAATQQGQSGGATQPVSQSANQAQAVKQVHTAAKTVQQVIQQRPQQSSAKPAGPTGAKPGATRGAGDSEEEQAEETYADRGDARGGWPACAADWPDGERERDLALRGEHALGESDGDAFRTERVRERGTERGGGDRGTASSRGEGAGRASGAGAGGSGDEATAWRADGAAVASSSDGAREGVSDGAGARGNRSDGAGGRALRLGGAPGGAQDAASGVQTSAQASPSAEEISDEWARWRERALKDIKRGQSVRPFASSLLPSDLHGWVSVRLRTCETADQVRAVFREARALESGEVVEVAASLPPATPAVTVTPPPAGDPTERMLHALLARMEQVAEQRAAQMAAEIASGELRALRTQVLEGLAE